MNQRARPRKNKVEVHPINFPFNGLSIFDDGDINLVILVFIPVRCGLLALLPVLESQMFTDGEQRNSEPDRACTDDGEWGPVSLLVPRLPDKRPAGVTHGIRGHDHGVDGDA